MKWTRTTGVMTTLGLVATGGIWAGCNGDNSQADAGSDSGGKDAVTSETGADASADAAASVDASVLDCNYYCANIATACTGSNNQYLDTATCVAMCANGPDDAGVGATSGDSLACRMYHLSVAATSAANAAIHCPHAGPFGYGFCGNLCENFCQQYFASNCQNDTTNGYATVDACHTYCSAASGADASAGAPGNAATSPAMLCREYHLENAIKTGGDGGGHCDHAGAAGGGGVCPVN